MAFDIRTLSITKSTRHYAEFHYAVCRIFIVMLSPHAECRYAECRNDECHYAGCHGTVSLDLAG